MTMNETNANGGQADASAHQEKLTFEQALDRLETLVAQIEEGEVPLEESIQKYAEGVGLIQQCRTILDQAESKIQLLAADAKGKLAPAGELPDTDENQ